MNLLALAPIWLVWVLVALLVAAAAEDATRLKISNITVAGVIAGAIAAAALYGIAHASWQNGLVFAALLAGGTVLFGRGVVGGGDVKLLAAVGLWCNINVALGMLIAVFFSGGILAMIILGLRMFAPATAAARIMVLRPRSGIPYGIAIAAGALISLAIQRR